MEDDNNHGSGGGNSDGSGGICDGDGTSDYYYYYDDDTSDDIDGEDYGGSCGSSYDCDLMIIDVVLNGDRGGPNGAGSGEKCGGASCTIGFDYNCDDSSN
ncbi:unnamed protein product, partial [Rotaria sordida]